MDLRILPVRAAKISRSRAPVRRRLRFTCVIVVSEGAAYADGRFPRRRRHPRRPSDIRSLGGVAPLVCQHGAPRRMATSITGRWQITCSAPRATSHPGSTWSREYAVGRAAWNWPRGGVNAVMPTIVRKASTPYKWVIGQVPLAQVAKQGEKAPRRVHPRGDGFGITGGLAARYLEPLIRR